MDVNVETNPEAYFINKKISVMQIIISWSCFKVPHVNVWRSTIVEQTEAEI